jgi:cysteine-rich repeat protein
VNGWVRALAVFDDGDGPALYAGGGFTTAGGVPANSIARWDGSNWSALGSGTNSTVLALAVFDAGSGPALYAGGGFTIAGGLPANRIARWDGSSWSALASGVGNSVHALAVFNDGAGPALYAGGIFTTAGGVPANRIAKWDGSSWSALGSGMQGTGVVALTAFDDGGGPALYAGGHFDHAGGVPASFIAQWDGSSWLALRSAVNHAVYALAVSDDGDGGPTLYAGGYFTTAGGFPADRIASWTCEAPSGACLMNGSCSDISENLCLGTGGSYQGDGTSCDEMQAQAQDWTTYQANKEHTGHVDVDLDPASFSLRWAKKFGYQGLVRQVAAADGKVFLSLQNDVFDDAAMYALDSGTGDTVWSKAFGAVYSVSPPAYAYGNVYIQSSKNLPSSIPPLLHAFDADDGTIVFQSQLFDDQWESYYAPTVDDGEVFVNGGYYGEMSSFDAFTGVINWYTSIPHYDQWTPAVDAQYAYAYVGENLPGLYVLDRYSGAVVFDIPDSNFEWNGWSMSLAPVLGGAADVFAIHDGRLIRFDLLNEEICYEIDNNFSGQVAYGDGFLYTISSGDLSVREPTTGEAVWGWASPQALNGTMIVTNTHVIAKSSNYVFAIDLITHQDVWSYLSSGELTLSENTLYIAGIAKVTAINAAFIGVLCGNGVIDPEEDCDGGACCNVGCTFRALGTPCRGAQGACDSMESCTGDSADCPPDEVEQADAVCDRATRPCELDAICDGVSPLCPNNPILPAGTFCGEGDGSCVEDSFCDGTSGDCPPDIVIVDCVHSDGCCPDSCNANQDNDCEAVCGNDVIEPGEQCDGGGCCNRRCTFDATGFVCRQSQGTCDQIEMCTGESADCPPDAHSTSVCRPDQGPCDVPESCDGVGNNCPPDGKEPAGTVCGPSTGPCDPEEVCNGSSNTCPPNWLGMDCIDSDGCCPLDGHCNESQDNDCTPICGNGALESGEDCEDGNLDECDGCTADCRLEFPCVSIPTVTPWGMAALVMLLLSAIGVKFGRRCAAG